jgi:hypothetical protein
VLAPRPGAGQSVASEHRVQPEVRLDALVARSTALQGALGVSVPLGRSVRVEVAAGAGPELGDGGGGATRATGRGDVIARFVLDPDRVAGWGVYGGSGLSVRGDPQEGTRALAAVVVGAERRGGGSVVPFAELGLGGGVRIGVGFRRAMATRR